MTNLERFTKALNWERSDRILTWDFIDNEAILKEYGGYDRKKEYRFEELVEVNAKAFKGVGLDMTRGIYDPVNHWMGAKIVNWIRFFGVDPDAWKVEQAGGTAWISQRPFRDLKGLEKNMPNPPKFEDVREWFEPFIKHIKEVFDHYDLVWVGGLEGPICDAYTYVDTELFMLAIYDAPELIGHIMDCTGKFSAYISQIYAEHATSPLLFMGEDICGSTGPFLSPRFLKKEGVPRWRWIMDPIHAKGYKFLFHTDGHYGKALPVILDDLNADGLHPFERNGCNDIFEIRKQYPRKLFFGNVCCEDTLPYGNVYDVEDETLELIERLGPHGGLFIGSSSELHDLVPLENCETLYRTVHEYGTYPLDIQRIQQRRAEIYPRLERRK